MDFFTTESHRGLRFFSFVPKAFRTNENQSTALGGKDSFRAMEDLSVAGIMGIWRQALDCA